MENPFEILLERFNQLERTVLENINKKNSTIPLPARTPDELMTRVETAAFLKVSKVTLWNWDKKGILNPRRLGNQVRYLKSEVMAANKPIRRR